jgi:hypothetical protein
MNDRKLTDEAWTKLDQASAHLRATVASLVEIESRPAREQDYVLCNYGEFRGQAAYEWLIADRKKAAAAAAAAYGEARKKYVACLEFSKRVDARMADLVTPTGVEKALASDVRPRRTEEITRLNRALDGIDDALTKLQSLSSR